MFTRQHHNALAKLFYDCSHTVGFSNAHLAIFAEEMAEMLKEDNPNFDKEKFLKECGVEG